MSKKRKMKTAAPTGGPSPGPVGADPYTVAPMSPIFRQRIPIKPGDVIVVESVSKWYGQVIGLSDITLKIRKGVTGLLGPNGAGKSTLLKCITGQIEPMKGMVTVDGMAVWGNPRIWDRMGYCPEQDAFWEWMSGRKFIHTLARMSGMSSSVAAEKTQQMLELVDMTDAADRRIGGYSRGMRQRIKIAQTLVHDPEILIYDEPLSGTDPLGRLAIIDIIHELESQGKTILVSSHVLSEVERLTDNILLINRGRLLAEGRVEDLRKLIDKHPHKIFIGTEQVEKLASRLAGEKWVWSVKKQGSPSAVLVETHKAEEFYSKIPGVLVEEGISVREMNTQDDTLDAVFSYLVK
jgi:ABC-2 type transport system ATP-binding protein